MRDEIVTLLRTEGQIRHLDPETMALATSFFLEHVDSNLEATAHRHPLGFIVMSESLGGDLTLRYHLWPRDWGVPDGQETGQTHDHRFELNSLIIGGSLRQLTFQTAISASGAHEVFEIHYNESGGSELRPTGLRADLAREADEIFEAARAYRLRPQVVHCVETVMRPAATVVLSVASPCAPPPRVFVPLGKEPPGVFDRQLLDAEEIAIARNAIAELRNRVSRPD